MLRRGLVKIGQVLGEWEKFKVIPESWQISYSAFGGRDLKFNIKPMVFKHTGLFPEQAANWDWMIEKITKKKEESDAPVKVLNLFAYTGGATVACLAAGAEVCHVDSSKGMTTWAKENVASSGLLDAPVRYIVDDVLKFVEREIRRGNKYDAIVMDPPSYGRGAKGEVWKFEDDIEKLVNKCSKILADKPLFFLINSYTTGVEPKDIADVLQKNLSKFKGFVECDRIGLATKGTKKKLSCGIYGRWFF